MNKYTLNVFISQPMNGRTDEEIAILREKTKKAVAHILKTGYKLPNDEKERCAGKEINFIDTHFKEFDKNWIPKNYVSTFTSLIDKQFTSGRMSLLYLTESLRLLSAADVFVTVGDYNKYSGCRIEHDAAKSYLPKDTIFIYLTIEDIISMTSYENLIEDM